MNLTKNWSRWLWLAGLVLLVGLHFWFPRTATGHANDTLGVGEEGKKAFFLLVKKEVGAASRNTQPLAEFTEGHWGETLCVLGANREPTDEEWRQLTDWVANGGSLVYAFPYEVFDRPIAYGEERIEEIRIDRLGVTLRETEVGRFLAAETPGRGSVRTPLVEDASDLAWRSGAEIDAPGAEVLLTIDGSVQAVLVPWGRGRVVIVATDEPFTNYELVVGDQGIFGYRLLETAGVGGIAHFDESLNDSATPKMVGILLEPEVRPLTIQVVLVVFVFCWWGRERFGPMLPDRMPARQDVVAHSDALGTIVHRAGDGQGALRAYYRQLLGEIGLGKGAGKRADRLLGPIARRLAVDVSRVKEVLRDAARACKNQRLGRRDAARHIRRLAKIRQAARTHAK